MLDVHAPSCLNLSAAADQTWDILGRTFSLKPVQTVNKTIGDWIPESVNRLTASFLCQWKLVSCILARNIIARVNWLGSS